MKTILITGSNGQLGSEIRKLSSKIDEFMYIFVDIDELDITNLNLLETFFSNNKVDFIVNCAAYTNVDKAETDTKNAELINISAVKNLAKISIKYKCPLIHISTDYVFDGNSKIPYKETDITNPQSAYGKTKLLGEEEAKKAYKHIIIRTAWLYSSFGNNFVKTMLRLGKEKDEINVVSDQIGSPTYASDLASAILIILQQTNENEENFVQGIYHYSNTGTCSWQEFAAEIMNKKGLNCKVNPVSSKEFPTPTKRPSYSLLDKTKITKTFNIDVKDWKIALNECLRMIL